MSYDFTNLTEAQQRLLTMCGWEPGSFQKQPRPGTVKKLLERGLLVARERPFMGIKVTVYEVPMPVHIAWCELCAQAQQPRAA